MTQEKSSPPDNSNQGKSTSGLPIGLILVGIMALMLMAGAAGFFIGNGKSEDPLAAADPIIVDTTIVAAVEDVAVEPAETAVPSSPTADSSSEKVTEASPRPTDTSEPVLETTSEPAIPTAEPTTAPILLPDGSPLDDAELESLYQVWELITAQYDGEVPGERAILDAAIAGSLETLGDRHTRYVPPAIAEMGRQELQGSMEGIGAIVQENEDGLVEIVRPFDGQPAEAAGLKPGDVLIEVDGQSVVGTNYIEVVMMVRGPEGSTVNLKVLREGEEDPLGFSIIRTRYDIPIIEAMILPEEVAGDAVIAYIRLSEFNTNAEDHLLEALNALLPEQPVGLVFDLRDNPGGFLNQSVAVADLFLPEGVALYERNIRGLDQTFSTDDGDSAETIPLVILVNAGSASASEIVAGAVQDRDRGVLIGETTLGKGSVQQVYTLEDGSELRVTIARWYTPDNHTIEGEGISPDIEVPNPEDFGGADDGQLRRAVDYLLNGE